MLGFSYIVIIIYIYIYAIFGSIENVEKSSYVLDCELWESKFDGLLGLVNEYIVDMKYENIYFIVVTQDLVCNSVLRSSPREGSGKFS